MDLFKILDTVPEPAIVDAHTMGVSGDMSGDYWLPAPMCLYQKELSEQIVSLHYSDILKYYETEDYNTDVVLHSMETMCLNSQYVATHPYLLIDHCVPKSLITKDIPNHLAETSGKFAVLKDLIALIQDYKTETAVVCRSDRTMDLLEALLLGNRVNIKRYSGQSIKTKQKARKHSCTCHLFPSDEASIDSINSVLDSTIHFDLLLCLDPSVDTSMPHIQRILTQNRPTEGPGRVAPIVRLTTINSIDHCELYHGKYLKPQSREYLAKVTAAVVVLRDVVGTLPPDLRPIYSQNLKYLRDWLEDPSIPWPLPDIYPIKTYTPMDVEKSLLTEVRYNRVEDTLTQALNNGRKRGRKPNSSFYKDSGALSYYRMKRLKNDYSTNPLNQNMAQLTGIASTKNGRAANYHLSGGLLTHKLIQAIGEAYYQLERQSSELEHFRCVEDGQLRRAKVITSEYEDIKEKAHESMKNHALNIQEAARLTSVAEEATHEIRQMEKQTEQILNETREKGPEYMALVDLFLGITKAQEDKEQQSSLTESKKSEHKYMSEELQRAQEALVGFEKDERELMQEINLLQQQIDTKLADDEMSSQKSQERIQKLVSQIVDEKAILETVEKQMDTVTSQLKKTPYSRVRSSNSVQHSKQRNHMNA
ncbi:LANO_0H00518g1_1 [Lachancea nothofagi CBS 11611]|uniref:LANO_0H00518g1_1 n=1 Tax=Lachancea nothofagi CBS 11611 TaxID=1266666 RepID=A0A1G4KKX9_9SACH|nr:LANO_0H00518g1_1 [Lachancea nothofagi CBS 11611]